MATISEVFSFAVNCAQSGRLPEAEQACRQILTAEPNYADAWHLLGVMAQQVGRHEIAAECLGRCIAIHPADAEAHSNLGVVQRELGRSQESLACFRQAVELRPEFAEAHYNLANALQEQENLDEAIAAYRRALELAPDFPDALHNLGNALRRQGKLSEAIACYRRSLELRPQDAETHSDLGVALQLQGDFQAAVSSYCQALALKPQLVEAHNRLGTALQAFGRMDDAVACFHRALELAPDTVETRNNLGNALKDLGQLDGAISCFRQGVASRPDFIRAHSNLLYTIQYSPAFDASAIYDEHRRWNEQHAAELAEFVQPHANDRTVARRLRVGYVSPTFRNHCQSLFTVPLFSSHDHMQCEVVCYSDDSSPDKVTERLRSYADSWRCIVGLSDQQVAEQIRADQIDILVDLTMHMANSRPLLFARKPAPVQVCWLAYPGTTGMTAIDYRLTDPYLDPIGQDDSYYSEESIRLPDTFWCYDPLTAEPAVNPLPALKKGLVTFGSLNNFCKTNDAVFKLWAQVLTAVDRSRLMLLAPETLRRQHIFDYFKSQGVSAERIMVVTPRLRPQYRELYHEIDIGLDTFPYNGHTTSLDSFWMGVPVVTLAGHTVVGRAGVSQLSNLGLTELIAHTNNEFVQIAAELANDVVRLSNLRAALRERMERSPLMDAPRFVRNIESAYREMWRRWCEANLTTRARP